jgi:hypothetical protein
MKYIYVRIAAYIGNTMKFDDIIEDIQFQLKAYYAPGDEIIFNALVESLSSFDSDYLNSISDEVGKYAQSINIPHHFLFHDTARETTGHRTNVYYLNTWAYITYKHSLKRHTSKWYPDSNKALFLIGKPLKRQRIGLMHHFYVNNLLDYLDYSLYFPASQTNIHAIKSLDIEYLQDDSYISKLLIDIQRPSLDIDISKCYDTNVFEYTGFPTNLKYYKNTCLSIVSENSFDVNPGTITSLKMPYLTEKLYRAMINHHPFIIIGDDGINEHLTRLGYKTFDKFFLPYTNRISQDSELILDWASKSVKHFIDNLDKNVNEIREMVRHNYNHYMNQTENEINQLQLALPGIELEHRELLGKL